MEQRPPRLLDMVRESLGLKHYLSKTEETYMQQILWFILSPSYHGRH